MGASRSAEETLPVPQGAPRSGRLQLSLALRIYCLSIATPALKAARAPLHGGGGDQEQGRRGGEGGRGEEGEDVDARDNPEEK